MIDVLIEIIAALARNGSSSGARRVPPPMPLPPPATPAAGFGAGNQGFTSMRPAAGSGARKQGFTSMRPAARAKIGTARQRFAAASAGQARRPTANYPPRLDPRMAQQAAALRELNMPGRIVSGRVVVPRALPPAAKAPPPPPQAAEPAGRAGSTTAIAGKAADARPALSGANLRKLLRPNNLAALYVLSEILQPPLALRQDDERGI
jgi:hypothetical protein